MNAKAAAEKLPQIKSEPVLALAEQLAPVLKAAEWHDRADAALAGIAKIDLRDIRSVIAAADRAARTEETRALAREPANRPGSAPGSGPPPMDGRIGRHDRRGPHHQSAATELTAAQGGYAAAPDMAERLANMAAEDLNPTANQQRWSTMVESVALSPVRTQVIPLGAPENPSEDLLSTVRRLADRVPQIASLFGIEPQAPSRGSRRPPPPPPTPAVGKEAQQAAEPPADTEASTPNRPLNRPPTQKRPPPNRPLNARRHRSVHPRTGRRHRSVHPRSARRHRSVHPRTGRWDRSGRNGVTEVKATETEEEAAPEDA